MKKKIILVSIFLLILFLKPYINVNYSNDTLNDVVVGSYSFGYTCGNCSKGYHTSCNYTGRTIYSCGRQLCCCGNVIVNGSHTYTGTRTCNVNGSTDTVKCAYCPVTTSSTCTHSVTVTVSAGTGGTVSSGTTCKPGATVSISATPNTGYSFSKWTTTSGTLTSATSASTSLKTSSSNVTVTANFTIKSYTLTVNPNGGTYNGTTSNSTFTQNYNTTKTIENPTPPAGYKVTFNGNGGTAGTSSLAGTATFSKWTLSGSGTFSGSTYTFGTANGTLTASYNYSSPVTLPSATRTNYIFNGWFDAATGGNKIGNAGETYTPTKAITLYAQWNEVAVPQMTITMTTPPIISKNGTINYKVTLNNSYYSIDKTKFEVSPTFSGTVTVSDIDSNKQFTVKVTNNGSTPEGEYKLVIKAGAIYKDSKLSSEISAPVFKVSTSINGQIRYSTMAPTRGAVVATFVPNYEGLSGLKTVSVDGQTGFSHIFTTNGQYTFNVRDSLGNTNSFVAKVDWIVSDQGSISVDYDVVEGGTIFTKILVKSNEKWALNPSQPIELIIKDGDGNVVTSNAKINVISVNQRNNNAIEIIVAIGKVFEVPNTTYEVKLEKVNTINTNTSEAEFINGLNSIQVKVYKLFHLD